MTEALGVGERSAVLNRARVAECGGDCAQIDAVGHRVDITTAPVRSGLRYRDPRSRVGAAFLRRGAARIVEDQRNLSAPLVHTARPTRLRAHLKGTVETINGAAEKLLFAALPRYTHRQKQINGAPVDPDQPPLSFEAFTAEVLAWVRWWNTEHTLTNLGDRSPMQSWDDDPTPIHDADETRLWMFTLEDDRRHRTITTKGVAFRRGGHYIADWMVRLVGTGVRIRYMPHHTGEIEVFDAATGIHLGTAVLADSASTEDRARVLQARARQSRQVRANLVAAEKARRIRYAASTVSEPATRLDAMTAAEVAAALAEEQDVDMARWARPDLIPMGPPPALWRRPVERDHADRHGDRAKDSR
ncbi:MULTISPECIES: Mu transposase C-terminal domain-containing protein [Rhodococcus]|uniref:Mu transposase C-terminal domain-containing protein n=1 Tax=Rhodococcus TaxID=1827 RepID=UPI0013EB6E41|nr:MULTISPECIES: Mu transposase C-terminal domain-containing protein [Rhodococcus]UTT51074.1 Mu transposase C-terminal domain-containing protein [Rhodococcus gordoniae]